MLDNQLIALIIRVLVAGEAAAGIAGTPIAQSFQPTMQGTNTQATLFLYKIGDHPYGFTGRFDAWSEDETEMVHTEIQDYETTFQLSGLAPQSPSTTTQYTASDLVNLAASILRSSVALQSFQAAGVGIEKPKDPRNPYFMDDRDQFEASPSFDFVITHKQTIVTTTPIAQAVELQVVEV